MKPLRNFSIFITIAALAVLFAAPIPAGEAVFSRSGNSVYLPGGDPGVLQKLDLDQAKIQEIAIPGIPNNQGISNLARSNAGFILCLTKSALYAWDDEKNSDAVVVCRPPAEGRFLEVAYSPANSTIALVTRLAPKEEDGNSEWALFALFKGDDEPIKIRCRRVLAIAGMAFDPDGDIHFGTDGDLWHGRIVREDDFGAFLQAYRQVPLATRETNMGTGDQMGAYWVEVAGKSLYAHVRRMGGSGWGHVIRMKRPAVPKSEKREFAMPFELPDRLEIYRNQLATVEILAENGTRSFLCASPDGTKVYFRGRRESSPEASGHWLVRRGGEPEEIRISGSE